MNPDIEELYVRDGQDYSPVPQQVKWYVKNLESWKSTADDMEEDCAINGEVNNLEERAPSDFSFYSHNQSNKSHSTYKSGFKFDGAPFAPPSRRAQEVSWNWVQPKWDEASAKMDLNLNRPLDYLGDGNSKVNSCTKPNSSGKPKNPRRNENRIINNNSDYLDTMKGCPNPARSIDYDLSPSRSYQSCVASIRDAPSVPFPRSSEILGIQIKTKSRSSQRLPRPIDMSGLRTKEVPTTTKVDAPLPSVESLFGLDKHETLSIKLGPCYRNPNIINNPAFRVVHDRQSKKEFKNSNPETVLKKYAGKL